MKRVKRGKSKVLSQSRNKWGLPSLSEGNCHRVENSHWRLERRFERRLTRPTTNSPNPPQYEYTSRSLCRLNSITNIDFSQRCPSQRSMSLSSRSVRPPIQGTHEHTRPAHIQSHNSRERRHDRHDHRRRETTGSPSLTVMDMQALRASPATSRTASCA
jgi:hypothetical protein